MPSSFAEIERDRKAGLISEKEKKNHAAPVKEDNSDYYEEEKVEQQEAESEPRENMFSSFFSNPKEYVAAEEVFSEALNQDPEESAQRQYQTVVENSTPAYERIKPKTLHKNPGMSKLFESETPKTAEETSKQIAEQPVEEALEQVKENALDQVEENTLEQVAQRPAEPVQMTEKTMQPIKPRKLAKGNKPKENKTTLPGGIELKEGYQDILIKIGEYTISGIIKIEREN